ncbi:DUF1804 family protein [Rhizobium pusense]|uniref:DUF1804 family protein n=1 Tax=Agrobacterium pusense TaxID=648995 RepID=UPI0024469051|nr:DUF1804 family protein [Agrobacterium pusense]MDH1094712.1 DUF1804 family protein [Agrobacterium pusense]MDH1111363.1 DUF1804 family protein [Agrobacterium pusense]MDH2192692.1 DUF1804 family protein [Agrobacterium pusense]
MSSEQDKRRKARADYVYRRMTGATIAMTLNISVATFGRWKKAAKEAGDDWDVARTASIIAGEGIETVVSTVIEDFMIMAQSVLEEIKTGELSLDQKVKSLVALADAMTKMTASAGKLAPKISELGVAQDVMQYLVEFVRENFPQHVAAILEIIEPFGESLARRYAS